MIKGPIREIRLKERYLTVALPLGAVRVGWTPATQFLRDTLRSDPKGFKAGETVRVVGTRTGVNSILARRIILGGQEGWKQGAIGEIVSLDSRQKEIEVDFDGEVWLVRAGTASIRRDGKRIGLDALRLGQDVRVFGERIDDETLDAALIELAVEPIRRVPTGR